METPIVTAYVVKGLVNVGPGSFVPGLPGQPSAGIWGYVGAGPGPSQTSSPPSTAPVIGQSSITDGVLGISEVGNGIHGVSSTQTTATSGAGVWGENTSGDGVVGTGYHGVHGICSSSVGHGTGVWGENTSSAGFSGVSGTSTKGTGAGVSGTSKNGNGVQGESQSSSTECAGVYGVNNGGGPGVYGSSSKWDGIHGESQSGRHAGVSGVNKAGGYGVWASGDPAGYFQGDVLVTGDVVLVNSGGGDVAEDFDIEAGSTHEEPGTVLVIGATGALCTSRGPYDTRVAGVVAGAGELRPAIVLQRVEGARHRVPIALIGKAFCKVDASFASIGAGDLLTTSSTPGHAMKVRDHARSAGAILGKALRGLENGRGLIPILVTPH